MSLRKTTLSSHSLVAIVGETGSGKSALALELAKHLNGEIVCADSSTIYKGFDIGTAKPTTSEQHIVPHHLIDVADARDRFSVALFQELARGAIQSIERRNRLPFLVGGSGLYVDSIIYDYHFVSPPRLERRTELNSLSLQQLLKEIKRLKLSTEGIDTQNPRRLIRLIERNGSSTPHTRYRLHPKTIVLGLQYPREKLQLHIEQRVDNMLKIGLEEEVKQLAKIYGWQVEPMKRIGYREWRGYFKDTKSLSETRLEIIQNSLALAKKQRTWFKRNKSIHWLSTEDKIAKAVELITTILNK